MKKIFKNILTHKILIFSLIFLFAFSGALYVFAIDGPPPVGGYSPGVVLDPDCLPGTTDCIVKVTASTLTGTATQIPYFNSLGNVTSDLNFTRQPLNNFQTDIIATDGTTQGNLLVSDSSSQLAWSNPALTVNSNLTTDSTGANLAYNDNVSGLSTVLTAGVNDAVLRISNFNTGLSTGFDASLGSLKITNNDTVTNQDWYWPQSVGAAGSVLTDVGGNGTLSWEPRGSVSLNPTQIAYGDGSSIMTSSSDFTWDDVNKIFSIKNTGEQTLLLDSTTNNFFAGRKAGIGVTSTNDSNFLGTNAGLNAVSASQSNYIGINAGNGAATTFRSNFLGAYAGNNASNTLHSNFIGDGAGNRAISINSSNFMGNGAGADSTNVSDSNFIGEAGNSSTNIARSNFIGNSAGQSSNNSSYSNFIGAYAGQNTNGAGSSNFIGNSAGNGATSATYSNFIGTNTGYGATNAINSIFIGEATGYGDIHANNSIFIGNWAGNFTVDHNILNNNPGKTSILIGDNTSTGGFSNSIALGASATNTATNQLTIGPGYTQFNMRGLNYTMPSALGTGGSNYVLTDVAGNGTLSWTPVSGGSSGNLIGSTSGVSSNPAVGSTTETWLGSGAGANSGSTNNTVFVGIGAGDTATGAHYSNFLGVNAGSGATDAFNANFIGTSAGILATGANSSNFIGMESGQGATDAYSSNFIGGFETGMNAKNAFNSNFIGTTAGFNATNANNSIFIGTGAGMGSADANNSIFIGNGAGSSDLTLDNSTTGYTSILIGDNTSTNGFSNSIALGAGATNTATNQFMIGSLVSPINDLTIIGTGFTTCTVDTGTGAGISCSSDENLKTNITDLSPQVLDMLTQVKTVKFNWKSGMDTNLHIGFIAQDVQKYFPELVTTGATGYLSVNYAGMTPVLTEAIRELNLKIEDLTNAQAKIIDDSGNKTFVGRFFDRIIGWLGDAGNGITDLFAQTIHSEKISTENLCVKDKSGAETCITKAELDQLLLNSGIKQNPAPSLTPTPDSTPAPTPDPVPTPDQNPTPTSDPTPTPTPDPTPTPTPDPVPTPDSNPTLTSTP